MQLDPTNGVPLYLQLADALRVAVASGVYLLGTELPSARDLAAEHRVNYHTVRRGFSLLEEEGVIEGQRGGRHRVVSIPAPRELLRGDVERLVRRARELGCAPELVLELVGEALQGASSRRERA